MRGSFWGAATGVAAVLVAGCGSGGGPARTSGSGSGSEPGDVVVRYYAGKHAPPELCATLSERFVAIYGGRAQCAKRVVPAPAGNREKVRIEFTDVQGDRAEVRFRVIPGDRGVARLVREAPGWRIDSFDRHEDPAEEQRERELREQQAEREGR